MRKLIALAVLALIFTGTGDQDFPQGSIIDAYAN